ncbi:MAG: HDOD domain-containing protein [Candidatus Lindowbacteria bacterium]|nr:HDOD domain-containing protein [Candidatus Lindowbacteria bacterium]
MAKVEIRDIVDRIQNLPTVPAVVTQILKMVNDPKSSANAVQAILGRDPSLTFKVLKLVNSAFYGYVGKIKTVHQAVVILGFNTIKSLALSATVFSAFGGKGRDAFDRDAFWRHSIAVGVAGRMIAMEVNAEDPEEAFVAGIIHDVGKVVLDEYAPEYFDQVLEYVQENDCLIYEAERKVLGSSHAQVGRWLAAKWGLPPETIDVVFYHHQPTNAKHAPQMTSIIHIADILARTLKLGSGGDNKIPPLDKGAWKIVGIEEGKLKNVLEKLPGEFAKADLFMQMVK